MMFSRVITRSAINNILKTRGGYRGMGRVASIMPTDHMSDKEVFHITKAHMDYLPSPSGDYETLNKKYHNDLNMRLAISLSIFTAVQIFMYFGGYYNFGPIPEMKNKK